MEPSRPAGPAGPPPSAAAARPGEPSARGGPRRAPPRGRSPLERALAPRALLLGVACSFLACCLAGRVLGRRNAFRHFTRLHPCVNYLTLYYPTPAQVRALARDRFDPGKVLVVVGGNSYMHGSGQGADGFWTRRLQELLGDDYQVLNLALHGAWTVDFAPPAAEVLSRDFPKLILLTNNWFGPAQSAGDPDGRPQFWHFFWEARARGWLAPHWERDERLRALVVERGGGAFDEVRAGVRLDRRLCFRDCWNAVAYRYFSTVWCPPLSPGWLRPRRAHADPDRPFPSSDESFLRTHGGAELPVLPRRIASSRPFAGAAGDDGPVPPLTRSLREAFPPGARRRTLVLIHHVCPYFVGRLTPGEREVYSALFPATVRACERAGLCAAEVGRHIPSRHYYDLVHLTKEGGRELAGEVAPAVRALARRLGYVPGGEE